MNRHNRLFEDAVVAVFGYGIEGKSVVQFLFQEKVKKIILFEENELNTDQTKEIQEFGNLIELCIGRFPESIKADVLFRSPGLRPDLPVFIHARRDLKLVTSSTNVFMARCPCPIIGVTGTKGKGTTSSLIAEMLKADGKDVYLGGNIGTPPLSFLSLLKPASIVVLELSSFQLWDCDSSPHIGVSVMVTKDHMDVHRDLSEYLNAKANIFRYQQERDFAIINWDHNNSQQLGKECVSQVYKTSALQAYRPGAFISEGNFVFHSGQKEEIVAQVNDVFIPGQHNLQNALSAITAAKIIGCSNESIKHVLQTFKGLAHRLEFVREVKGVNYYDDSFSTVPETAVAAINAFKEPKILILGGSSKQSDFSYLGSVINSSSSIRAIIGIGQEWQRIKAEIRNPLSEINYIEGCTTMKEVVNAAKDTAQPGDVVVLSPACASFGMFENYKDRGNQFKEQVQNL